MSASHCPPDDALAAFACNALARDRMDEIAAHLVRCPACEQTLGLVADFPPTLTATVVPVHPAGPVAVSGGLLGDRYVLRDRLGVGGMGYVYRAEQLTPVRRVVAVKVMRPGLDSDEFLARFEGERQALAAMDHPNIARVFDAGRTADGRPFLALELVDGPPLTRWCDAARLGTRGRVALFVPVCRAVQHAHLKGVIHRDLKPSNVLVAEVDGRPVPKVIDFGIAKATGQGVVGHTQTGVVVGTPEYMSPEQAGLTGTDVDTRSDVYALGVVLYELLVGTTPFPPTAAGGSVWDLLRKIREEDPPTLESKLNEPETAGPLAETRRCSPDRLRREVRGELQWVVLRALERDRERRYQSANALADDLERYLRDEPLEAGPPVAFYHARKFVHRHRIQVVAAGLLLLALLAGIAGTTFGLIRAEHRRADAELARGHEAEQRAAAEIARERAERARDRTWEALEAMTSWVTGEALTAQPALTGEQRRFLAEVLAYYQQFAAEQADDEPARARTAEAALRVAAIEYRLGRMPESAAATRTARDAYARLVADFPAIPGYRERLAGAYNNLGLRLNDQGKPDEAEVELRRAVTIRGELVVEFPDDPSHRYQLAAGHTNLGVVLSARGERSAAVAEYRRAIAEQRKLADAHPKVPEYRQDLARSHSNLSGLLSAQGDQPAAESHIRVALALLHELAAERPGDPTHRSELAAGHANLGVVLAVVGQPGEAVAEYREALAILEKLSADFPGVPDYRQERAARHFNLGLLLVGQKTRSDAEGEYRKALALQEPLAAEFPAVSAHRHRLAAIHSHLAALLNRLGKVQGAEEQFRKAVALRRKLAAELTTTPDDRDALAADHTGLGELLTNRGNLTEGEEQHRLALDVRETLADEFPDVTRYQTAFGGGACNLGCTLTDGGRPKDGLVWFDKAIRTLTAARERDRASAEARDFLGNSHAGRAVAYHHLRKYGEALQDWDRAVELDPQGEKPWVRAMRAASRVKGGRAAEAVAEVAELTRWPVWDAGSWVLFAEVYAQAGGQVKGKEEEYAARAVELLRKAVKAGLRDASELARDEDLAPLRDRADFKKLLADLEVKFPPKREVLPPPRADK